MAWTPAFKELLRSLNDEHVRYLVVVGYAVILHGHPRTTIDLDLWTSPISKTFLKPDQFHARLS